MCWIVSVREGDIGVWDSYLHRMYGLSFTWHLHVVCVHMHFNHHSRIVELGGLLLKLHVLVSVKNWVDLLACSIRAMRCTALLWRDILRFFMCEFSHVDRRCGHVSVIIRHNMSLGFWCVRGQKVSFLWLPTY